MQIQSLNQKGLIVHVTDLAPSNKKNVIKVLHVDDELGILEVSKQILTMENNFEIDNAISIAEAFEKIDEQQYDAVVSDYEMPQKNGLEFLKELRDKNNQIPFILFTGKGREDVAVKALNLGADSYINKNGSPETVYCELADAINKTVERKKSRELLAKSESKYHALVENSLQGIAILQVAPIRIVFANGAFGKTLGYSSEELTSLSPQEIMSLVYQADRTVFFKRMENRLRGEPAGACYEFRAVRKDGSIIWLSSLANRVEYDGQPAVQGMFLDITESKKAAEILYESEQRYRELANCLPDIVFETDLNGRLEFANERAVEISGYSLNDLEKGANIFQFIVPEDKKRATENIQRLLAGGSYEPSEYTFIRKDGTTFPALITATPRVCKNKVTGFRGIVLDISERKKAEEVVKKSEKRYKELANFLPEIIFETDLSGKITFLSQTAFEITGYTPDEIERGMNMLQFVVPEDRERAKENIRRRMAGEKSDTSEYTLFRKNGDTYPAIVKTAPIFSENKLVGLRGLVIDITERKKAEEALSDVETRYRVLVENADDAILLTDLRGKHIYRNPAFCRSLGYEEGDIMEFDGFLKVHPDEAPLVKEKMSELLKTGSVVSEYRVKHRDGRWLDRFAKSTLIYNTHNQPYAILAIIRDITERKNTEEALRKSEEEYGALFANMIDGFAYCQMLFDKKGKPNDFVYLQVNDAFERITGLRRDVIIGKNVTEAIPGIIEANPELFEIYGRVALTGKKEKFEVFFKPLSLWLSISVYSPQKGYFAAVFEDITERKNIEQQSFAEHALVHEVINSTNSLIFSVDRNYCYTSFNRAHALVMKTIFGVDIQIGKSMLDYLTVNLDHERAKQNIDKALAGEHLMEESFSGDEKLSQKYFIISHSPIRNADGEVTGVVVVSNDITEHKKAEEELEKNQAKIEIMNEKLNIIGRLTRHDVGNKLMVMKSNIYLLKKQIGDNPNLAKFLEGIDSAINQSGEMFEFSRSYEKIGVEAPMEIDVAQCFNQAAKLLPNLGAIKIVNNCQGLNVTADSLLKQLFYNFLDNSLKYGEKVTQIRLYYTKEGDGLKLFYEDDGVGVPEANKPKLFHEGFTTGKSTGLGLFLIKKMVEVYGWSIIENGEPGKGARFVITIPKVN